MSLNPDQAAEKYLSCLDQLILDLRTKYIEKEPTMVGPVEGVEAWDAYLLEVNSFYYSSFTDHYLPQWREMIIADFRDLINLRRQDESLQHLIMTSLKRLARLYNQLKHMSALFKNRHQEINAIQLVCQHGLDAAGVQLIFIWKELQQFWSVFRAEVQELQIFLDDSSLQTALNEHPGLTAVGVLLDRWDPRETRSIRELNRLLAGWQLGIKLAAKYYAGALPAKDDSDWLDAELGKIDASWDNRKTPAILRTWYKKHVQSNFNLYRDTMRLAGERNERRLLQQVAGQFQDWLQSLLLVVEKGLIYRQQNRHRLIAEAFLTAGSDAEALRNTIGASTKILQAVEEALNGLTSSAQAEYANYSLLCARIVADSNEFMRGLQADLDNGILPILAPAMQRLRLSLESIELRLELLDAENDRTTQLIGKCQEVSAALGANQQFLQSLQEDLLRELTPRSLKHIWADIDLDLEHLVVSTGAMFPARHQHLIDEGFVKTRSAPVPEGRILYAAGDIFIIKLEGRQEMEIPEIVIAGRS